MKQPSFLLNGKLGIWQSNNCFIKELLHRYKALKNHIGTIWQQIWSSSVMAFLQCCGTSQMQQLTTLYDKALHLST